MTRERESQLVRPRSVFARVLSLLLLSFIVYGTTVEAAHTHGSATGTNSIVGASTFSNPARETNATVNLQGCGDCLICQLHQHFSATLISVPPSIGPSSLKARSFDLTTATVHSQASAPRRGRAPPITA